MTQEQFKRAKELNGAIEILRQLDNILLGATTPGRTLAVVNSDEYYGANVSVCHGDIPQVVLVKLRQLVADEAVKLNDEFTDL